MEQAMIGEFDIYGVYFPAIAIFAAIAFVIQVAVKRILDAYRVYRFVSHRALIDLAIYVILLGVVTAVAEIVLPLV
jgi:protein AaeX